MGAHPEKQNSGGATHLGNSAAEPDVQHRASLVHAVLTSVCASKEEKVDLIAAYSHTAAQVSELAAKLEELTGRPGESDEPELDSQVMR